MWPQVRDAALAAVEKGGLIDQYYMEIKNSYEKDYEIWKDDEAYRDQVRDTYPALISNLKLWTRNRIDWMDSHIMGNADDHFPTLDETVRKITYLVDGHVVRKTCQRISGPAGS